MRRIRFFIALYIAKVLSFGIKLIAKDRGTNLPGVVALKVDPQFVSHIKGLDMKRTIFITGTNGKSTTTNLLAHVFKTAGYKIATNLSGANLLTGVAVALIQNVGLNGKLDADIVLLETDERYLPIIHRQLPAENICVLNLQKDQAQRNGEPGFIYNKVMSVINDDITLFVNNDEPNSRSLGRKTKKCINFGVEKNDKSFDKKDDFFSVTMPCPICSHPIEFKAYNIDNTGPFVCRNCNFGEDKTAEYLAGNIDFENGEFSVESSRLPFHYNAPYFLYCYIASTAIARTFGVEMEKIRDAFDCFVNVKGRTRTGFYGGKSFKFSKIKQENPETLQSVINYIAEDKAEDKNGKILLCRLDERLDFYPPYTNTFYLYDCDFRGLLKSKTDKFFCISDTLRNDMKLRLLYDGFGDRCIETIPDGNYEAVAGKLAGEKCDDIYIIEEIPKLKLLEKYIGEMQES